MAALVAVAALALVGVLAYGVSRWYRASRAAAGAGGPAAPPVSLAVLPFRNASGDPALDSLGTSLSEVLATDLGEASQIRTIPSVRLREVLRDLRIDPNANLSPSDLARIADFASAQTILWGQYVKFGDEIRIDATLQNLAQQKTTPLKATAANQSALLTAVAPVRRLGAADPRRRLRRRPERAEVVGMAALDAVVRGAASLQRRAEPLARRQPPGRREAVRGGDPGGRELRARLFRAGQTYANLGYDAKATQQSRRAIEPERSRSRPRNGI